MAAAPPENRRPAPDCDPLRVSALNPAEGLLLTTIRAWLTGGRHWKRCVAAVEGDFGTSDGERLLLAVDCLMWVLNRCGLRALRFGSLHCPRVWPDEAGLLAVLDLAQQGERATAVRLLLDILPPTAAGVVADYAGAAGGVLARHGLPLDRAGDTGHATPEDDLEMIPATRRTTLH